MKFEYEILESDLEDRKKIIEMKEMIKGRVESLSSFGRSSMSDALVRLKNDTEYAETQWLLKQRDRLVNKFSEALNVNRSRLGEKYWYDEE